MQDLLTYNIAKLTNVLYLLGSNADSVLKPVEGQR